MMVSRWKSGSRKPLQKNATTSPDIQTFTSHIKYRNAKPTNLSPRGSPLDPHKRSVSPSPVIILKNQDSSPKYDPPLSAEHSSTSQNTQRNNHHSEIVESTNPDFIDTTLQSPSVITSPKSRFASVNDSTSSQHNAPSPDSTSKYPLKVNSHFFADKVLDTTLATNPINCNPLTSMEIDASTLTPLKESCPQSPILISPCLRTLPTYGSTSSILSPTPPNLREQSPHNQHKPQHTLPDQKPPVSAVSPVTTHTSTLPPTPTNNSLSGKLGSPQEGNTASHQRSTSKMVVGMPDAILDTNRGSNEISFKNPNPSNPCEYSVWPSRSELDLRASDCVSHNHANIQRLSPLKRTQGSDPRTSTNQENTEWHRDNIRVSRCRSPRNHDHSSILREHPDSHSLPDDRQRHYCGGRPSENLVTQAIDRPPPTKNASRALVPCGDEPICIHNSHPQSGSLEQNIHQEKKVFRSVLIDINQ
ncbi:hypothetical protein FCV25MIE_28373 [Fagus crenata]